MHYHLIIQFSMNTWHVDTNGIMTKSEVKTTSSWEGTAEWHIGPNQSFRSQPDHSPLHILVPLNTLQVHVFYETEIHLRWA